jgi:hypothetical protein
MHGGNEELVLAGLDDGLLIVDGDTRGLERTRVRPCNPSSSMKALKLAKFAASVKAHPGYW